MKTILLAVTLLFSVSAQSQTETKQPKLRYTAGFFTTKWELGDKDVTEKEIRAHLQKHSAEAYHYWRKSEGNATTSMIFSIITTGGLLTGLFAKESDVQLTGYSVAALSGIVSLITTLSSGKNADRAVNTYNKQMGY